MPRRGKSLEQPLLPLTDSPLRTPGTSWLTSASYQRASLPFSATAFHSVTDALLENPNLNSSLLFRADIVSDSTGILKTNKEKEAFCCSRPPDACLSYESDEPGIDNDHNARLPPHLAGFEVRRTVLRRLIPRNPQLDRSLLQTCHIYTTQEANLPQPDKIPSTKLDCGREHDQQTFDEKLNNKLLYKRSIARHSQHLVLYQPHADPLTGSDMPWYHPSLKYLAFVCSSDPPSGSDLAKQPRCTLSIHFQLFQASCVTGDPSLITNRVHRTLLSLLSTFVRLCRNTPVCLGANDSEEKAMPLSATQHIKDNIVPEHLVQNTYCRLKARYAPDLIKRWVEKTDPSKHVFEDLSIAAFLLELWKIMYGSDPSDFPGFVDIGCGNGVLVYVLIMEGFRGFGFDARVRRTWSLFPAVVTSHLKQIVCIPSPFLEALQSQKYPLQEDLPVHDGIFEAETFIISNHADELTTWTPLLAALSCPESPLPWLAIPCCSHALSGAAHRYQSVPPEVSGAIARPDIRSHQHANSPRLGYDEQPLTGDLTILRASKDRTIVSIRQGLCNRTNSTYASLVNHVTCLARRVDPMEDVRQTLMRIPSTRNIGIVGGQQRALQSKKPREAKASRDVSGSKTLEGTKRTDLTRQIYDTVKQECIRSGGVAEAAKIWMVGVQKAVGTTRHTVRFGQGQTISPIPR